MHSAFTRGLLQQLATQCCMIPYGWENLAKVVLEENLFLQFRSWWQDEAQQQLFLQAVP